MKTNIRGQPSGHFCQRNLRQARLFSVHQMLSWNLKDTIWLKLCNWDKHLITTGLFPYRMTKLACGSVQGSHFSCSLESRALAFWQTIKAMAVEWQRGLELHSLWLWICPRKGSKYVTLRLHQLQCLLSSSSLDCTYTNSYILWKKLHFRKTRVVLKYLRLFIIHKRRSPHLQPHRAIQTRNLLSHR